MKHCSACACEISREWRRKNRERHRAYSKRWAKEHPEQRREQARRTNHNCLPRIRAWRRIRRKLVPHIYKLGRKRWEQRHPDKRRSQKSRNKQRRIQRLTWGYVRELLRDATSRRGKPFNPTPELLARQKLKTQMFRSKLTLKTMATAAAIKP